MKQFNELIANPKILRGIREVGYENPTEIQERAIPFILEGKDIIAKSNTGTGKTASFGLPLLQRIYEGEINQVLIVCPTRELAMQVEEEFRRYSKYTDSIKIVSVYGGTPIERQIRAIKKGAKVIVGTPGRILDHVKRKTIKLANYDCVVLDEADEMLNMGFREDIEDILNKIQVKHQTILFSATMPKPIREIAQTYLSDHVEIDIKAQYKTVDTIEQVYYDLKRKGEKPDVVKRLLTYHNPNLSLIFCNMKSSVDDLVHQLNKSGIRAMGLHGDIRQEKRTKIMAEFKNTKQGILIASDVAARGIDVNNIDLVINYDVPHDKEVYIHRIGRTGRAGKKGLAITLVQGKRQYERLKSIANFTKAQINRKELPTEENIQKKKSLMLKEDLKARMKSQDVKKEHMNMVKELLNEGYSYPAIVSSLFSMIQGEQNKIEPKRGRKKIQEGVELKIALKGRSKISKGEIEKAIVTYGKVKSEQVGAISIKKHFAVVNVEKKVAKKIVNEMNKDENMGNTFDIGFYKKR